MFFPQPSRDGFTGGPGSSQKRETPYASLSLRLRASGRLARLLVWRFSMALERTLSIVKPDGVGRNLIGEVYRRFGQAGLRVVAARMAHLSQREAEAFYAVHKERPFYGDLVRYM